MIYDTIVFENLRFRPSTRRQKAGVFKNFHPGWRAFLKRSVFGDRFHQIRVDGGPNRRKNIHVQTKTDTFGRGLRVFGLKNSDIE